MALNKKFFEDLYKKYNSRKYAYSDPISLVYSYKKNEDIEIAALIASSLAYGNVKQIIKSLSAIFSVMGNSPRLFLEKRSDREISRSFLNFKHRFTTGAELAIFMLNIKKAIRENGSLENLFIKNLKKDEPDLSASIYSFINSFNSIACAPTLTPCPEKKSSFKRFNLFLRWMIRKDAIDLGIWEKISPSMLIIPLDTHMLSISQKLGITNRKDGSMKTAREITDFFRTINPYDPVKYDFSLTRTGILKNFK
ncbi:MAG: TIGR02757 family protein [Elusimicrobiota bacterium]